MERKDVVIILMGSFLVLFFGLYMTQVMKSETSLITGSAIKDTSQASASSDMSSDGASGIEKNTDNPVSDMNGKTPEKYKKDLISMIISLKKSSSESDLVKIAFLVTSINNELSHLDSPNAQSSWRNVLDCVYETCSDDAYLDFIDNVDVSLAKDPEDSLIHNIIATFTLWNGKNELLFSEQLTATNSLFEDLGDSSLQEEWSSFLTCNKGCPDRLFLLIDSINNFKN